MVPESGVQARVRFEKPEALITVTHLSKTGFTVHRVPQLFFKLAHALPLIVNLLADKIEIVKKEYRANGSCCEPFLPSNIQGEERDTYKSNSC